MVERLSLVSKITAISSSRSVSVHLTLPSGALVQAFAITFACISPVALRLATSELGFLLGFKAATGPSLQNLLNVSITVGTVTPERSAI